jgi:hypothetical protein
MPETSDHDAPKRLSTMGEIRNLAREAARHAGDGGHVRLRVMALSLLARIDPRESASHARALEMSRRLEDELLLARIAPNPVEAPASPAKS